VTLNLPQARKRMQAAADKARVTMVSLSPHVSKVQNGVDYEAAYNAPFQVTPSVL